MAMLKLKKFDAAEIKKYRVVENRFVCSICIEIFTTIELLKNHYIDFHSFKEKKVDIPLPNEDYFSESSEQSIVEAAPKESYFSPKICNICEMKFKNQKTLSKHIKHVHNKLKQLICQVCNKQFTRKSTLDIHARTHLSADDSAAKVLSCNICLKFKCSDPSVMSKHKKLHDPSAVGKYKCQSCNYLAIQATGLKNHMKFKHAELFLKMKCNQCEFVSVNPDRLKQHILNHEKGLIEQKEETQKIEEISKSTLNTSMEISSDCFLPIESADSIHNHDQGGVTIIHTNNSSTVHSEDAVF
ncbi:hypothetical protein PVAND_010343 [Polypedilum vanderplanki]|uniref:C2H2-type domain-containing protein n=1 Tax=Polypedilum vanderplanki TaxID=319348 RepID=A0A9J6CGZ6_POLVA|nr:hypothetical protein PVAND_010343 [Polypedilum vanderplanki]